MAEGAAAVTTAGIVVGYTLKALIGVNLALNVGVRIASWGSGFSKWWSETFGGYHIHKIDSKDESNRYTQGYTMISKLLSEFILENYDSPENTINVTINNQEYKVISGNSFVAIKIAIDNKRKKELGLSEDNIEFWIYGIGNKDRPPINYEIWAAYANQFSDIYRLFTLFFRSINSDCSNFINFTKAYRICDYRIMTQTYNNIIDYNNGIILGKLNLIKERMRTLRYPNPGSNPNRIIKALFTKSVTDTDSISSVYAITRKYYPYIVQRNTFDDSTKFRITMDICI